MQGTVTPKPLAMAGTHELAARTVRRLRKQSPAAPTVRLRTTTRGLDVRRKPLLWNVITSFLDREFCVLYDREAQQVTKFIEFNIAPEKISIFYERFLSTVNRRGDDFTKRRRGRRHSKKLSRQGGTRRANPCLRQTG